MLRLDIVCGGPWWRQIALDAFGASGGKTWEMAAEAVSIEYARRIAKEAKMHWAVAPVYRSARQQPLYPLIFLTHDVHGLWVMGDSIAVARQKWLRALGPSDDEISAAYGLVSSTSPTASVSSVSRTSEAAG